jgi:hypothetical protein
MSRRSVERMELVQPRTDAEFEAMMFQVDERLRQCDVPIPARAMEGWRVVGWSLGLSLSLGAKQIRATDEAPFTGSDLTRRIFNWFETQYGKRLSVRLGPGRIFVLLAGDPWVVHLPFARGQGTFFVSLSEKSSPDFSNQPFHLNVLDLVEDLPSGLAARVSPIDLENLLRHTVASWRTFELLRSLSADDLVHNAIANFDAVVHHVMARPPNFGEARWAALQASEKLVKAAVQSRRGKFPFTHDLATLNKLLPANGLPPLDLNQVGSIQCEAAVRYDRSSTLIQAYSAFLASISLCGGLAEIMVRDRATTRA